MTKTSAQANKLFGIGLMLLAMLMFPGLDVLAKTLGAEGQPVMQSVWSRLALGALLTLPLLAAREGRNGLTPRAIPLNMLRGLAIISTTFFFFSAMKFQGIAQTLSLYFVQPILVIGTAPLLLGERMKLSRWLAVVGGFIGVLVIIRPGMIALNPGALLALASGASAAVVILTSRMLASKASALSNTFYTSLWGGIVCTLIMLWQWQAPTPTQWLMMFGIAALGTTCNFLIIKAFEWCEASLLAPFGYAEMINAVFLGWLFFGDLPDRWTFVGVAILIGAALYASSREHTAIKGEIPAQV
jgi:drug/metabolite transporter (DMT)-like permease